MKQKYWPLFLAITTAFLILFTAVACKQPGGSTSSIVRVDNDHYLWREDSKPYLVYKIPAGEEFVLDAADYEFDTSKFMYIFDSEPGESSATDLRPNTIEILIGQIIIAGQEDPLDSEDANDELRLYRTEWNPNSLQQTINAKALVPVGETPPPTQFEPGQEMIITIGYLEEGKPANEALFYPFWSGLIDIQE